MRQESLPDAFARAWLDCAIKVQDLQLVDGLPDGLVKRRVRRSKWMVFGTWDGAIASRGADVAHRTPDRHLVLLPPQVAWIDRLEAPGGSMTLLSADFQVLTPAFAPNPLEALDAPFALPMRDPEALRAAAGDLLATLRGTGQGIRLGPAARLRARPFVDALLLDLLADADLAGTATRSAPMPAWFRELLAEIDRNPAPRRNRLEDLARRSGYSRSHLDRAFRRHCGLSPAAWVRRKQLARAEELVADGRAPFGEVARRCGFASAAHFSRAFKRAFGLTPKEARAKSGRPPW